jgi:hypothetical protein
MNLTEFKNKFIKDQKHLKRLRLYRAGHTDYEIAVSCGVTHWTIGDWRKKYSLPPNTVIHGKSYKDVISKRIRGVKQA